MGTGCWMSNDNISFQKQDFILFSLFLLAGKVPVLKLSLPASEYPLSNEGVI